MATRFVKPFHTALALSSALVVGACSAAAPAPEMEMDAPADLAAVDAVRDAYMDAVSAGDAEAIGNLYTADGISLPNHAATVSGRTAIVAHQQEMLSDYTVSMEIMPDETRTMGDFGFDRGRYRATMTPKAGGEPMTDEGRYIVLLQKEADGSWKVSRDLDNSTIEMPMMDMEMPETEMAPGM